MKTFLVVLAVLLITSHVYADLPWPYGPYLTNGDFSNGMTGWTEYHSSWTNTSPGNYQVDANPGYLEIYSPNNYFFADSVVYRVVDCGPGLVYWSMEYATNVAGWVEVGVSIMSRGTDYGYAIENRTNGYSAPNATVIKLTNSGTVIPWTTIDGVLTLGPGQVVVYSYKMGSYPQNTNNCYLYGDNVVCWPPGSSPEPSSFLGFGAGFAGLLGFTLRKRK